MVTPERVESLQTAWVRLLGGYGVGPAAAYPVFDRLVAAHAGPGRYYHTLEHVGEVLRVADRLARFAGDPPAVLLAAWFHDAVYDPTRRDNEVESRRVAADELTAVGLPPGVVAHVGDMILATVHGTADAPVDSDTAVLLDADLAILAAAGPRYRRYAADIRAEYAHVPDDAYRTGRAAVLEHFLARPRVYRTDVMFADGEAAARQNLAAEIAALRDGTQLPAG